MQVRREQNEPGARSPGAPAAVPRGVRGPQGGQRQDTGEGEAAEGEQGQGRCKSPGRAALTALGSPLGVGGEGESGTQDYLEGCFRLEA